MGSIQVLAENVTVGMMIIPAGRKQPLEVLMADDYAQPGRFQFGCYGNGFSVHAAIRGDYVTVAL